MEVSLPGDQDEPYLETVVIYFGFRYLMQFKWYFDGQGPKCNSDLRPVDAFRTYDMARDNPE